MTKRKAKAVEVLILLKRYRKTETGVAFSEEDMKIISDALEWQAEQCVLASGGLKGDQQMIAIRNAGMEESNDKA